MSSILARKFADWTIPQEEKESVRATYMTDQVGFAAVVMNGREARLYDVRRSTDDAARLLQLPVRHPLTGFAFRPKNEKWPGFEAAVAYGDDTVSVLRINLSQLEDEPRKLFMPRAHSVAYSHDGAMLAAGSTDGLLRIWRLYPQPQEIVYVSTGQKCVNSLAFDNNNSSLFFTSGCNVRCLNIPAAAPRQKPAAEGEEAQAKPVVNVWRYLVSNENKEEEFNWDCYCVQTHPLLPLVAFGGYGGDVLLHNHKAGPKSDIQTISTGAGRYVRSLHFIAQHNQLLVVGQTGVEVWNLGNKPSRFPLAYRDQPGSGMPLGARQYADTVYVMRTQR
jgi:hypothetical protein